MFLVRVNRILMEMVSISQMTIGSLIMKAIVRISLSLLLRDFSPPFLRNRMLSHSYKKIYLMNETSASLGPYDNHGTWNLTVLELVPGSLGILSVGNRTTSFIPVGC